MTARRAEQAEGRARRSRWIPWVFVWGFGIVLAANGIMVFFAFDSFTGISTADSWQRGLAFDRQLEAQQRARTLAWRVAARLDPAAAGHRLTLAVHDRTGRPLSSAQVRAEFLRPVEPGFDFDIALRPLGNGRYDAPVGPLRPGQWRVRFRIAAAGERIAAERRFMVAR